MITASELKVQLWVEREELVLHLWLDDGKGKRYVSAVNIRDKLDLSDEQAVELLAELNRQADQRTEGSS